MTIVLATTAVVLAWVFLTALGIGLAKEAARGDRVLMRALALERRRPRLSAVLFRGVVARRG